MRKMRWESRGNPIALVVSDKEAVKIPPENTGATVLNIAVRDTERPLIAPSLSNVTLLLMKSIEHPKQRIKATRMSSTITIRRNHSNTFLRRERR